MADTYRRGCNTIESRNAFLKNGRMGLGDKTRRLVRGFANATLVAALGIVGVNIHLIQKFLHRVVFDVNTNPSDPVPTQPCKRVSDWNTFGNVAPQAPSCSVKTSKDHGPYGPWSTGCGLLPNETKFRRISVAFKH